jgi:uncharacterized protein YdgA (DUF945 family)
MRRLLPTLVLLAAVMAAGWYTLAASLRGEREYTALVDELARASEARVLQSHFERGLLASRARTSVEVAGGAGFLFRSAVTALGALDVRARVGVQVSHEIEHGPLPVLRWIADGCKGSPVLARIRSTLEIDQESQLALAEAVGKFPPVEAETVVRTAGQAVTTFWVESESLRAKGQDFEREGRWLGLDGEVRFSEGFRHVAGVARSPGFEGRGEDRAVELRDLVWHFDLPGSELPVGRVGIEVGELLLDSTTAGVPALRLEGLEIEAESKLAVGRYAGTLGAQVTSVKLGDESWGPGSLRAVLDDVDGHALRRLRRAALRVQSKAADGDPAATAVAAVDVLEALPQLLARGPRLALQHLQLATPAGPVAAHGQVTLVAPDLSEGEVSLAAFLQTAIDVQLPAAVLDAVLDARARSEFAAEGGDASGEAGAAIVRQRREAKRSALRDGAALRMEGEIAHLRFSLGGGAASEPAATPVAERPPAAPAQAAPAPAAPAHAAAAPDTAAASPSPGPRADEPAAPPAPASATAASEAQPAAAPAQAPAAPAAAPDPAAAP